MRENNRPNYSVDDYYPKRSSSYDEEPEKEEFSKAPEEDTADRSFYDYNNNSDYTNNQQEDSSGGMITCPKCGTQVAANMNFCSMCGYHFPKAQDTPYPLSNERIDGYLEADISSFVGMNAPTYLHKFKKVSEGRISFNWAAAIFSNRWIAYRGMFKQAFAFSIIINAFSLVISYVILSMYYSLGTTISQASYSQINLFSMMLTVAVGLIVGLLGDNMYWKHTKKHMDACQCRNREPVSNRGISQSLAIRGGYKMGFALLIICFDLTCNEGITYLLEYLLTK